MTLLDWSNPPRLTVRKRQPRDLDALSRSHAKRIKRKSGKAHATNKERSHETRLKNAVQAKLKRAHSDARKAFLSAVRVYWRGEGDHP